MLRTAVLIIIALVLHVPDRPPTRRGPPLLCHELDIRSAPSLPWQSVGYGMGREPSFDRTKVVPETFRILTSSDDSIVHAETLRRAYLYLQTAPPLEEINDLGLKLKDAVVMASLPDSPSGSVNARRESLAWFDLA